MICTCRRKWENPIENCENYDCGYLILCSNSLLLLSLCQIQITDNENEYESHACDLKIVLKEISRNPEQNAILQRFDSANQKTFEKRVCLYECEHSLHIFTSLHSIQHSANPQNPARARVNQKHFSSRMEFSVSFMHLFVIEQDRTGKVGDDESFLQGILSSVNNLHNRTCSLQFCS